MYMPNGSTIVTTEPLLFSLVCGEDQKAFAYQAIGRPFGLARLEELATGGSTYLFEDMSKESIERVRFSASTAIIDTFELRDIRAWRVGRNDYRLARLVSKEE
jgi:hypothetical protein